MKQFMSKMKKNWSRPKFIISNVILLCTILIISALVWQIVYFNTVDFEQILYNLLSPLKGANTDVFSKFAWQIAPLALAICLAISCLLATLATDEDDEGKTKKTNKVACFIRNRYLTLNLILFGIVAVIGFTKIGGVSYVMNHYFAESEFYEKEYVDPNSVELTFPDEKRNLIYIFCESMENSFMSKEYGGAQKENYIPELTKLMEENTSFYNPENVNGAAVSYNCDWTVAAMTAHTSSVPLVLPLGENEENYSMFLPGLTTLGDILKEEGYNQQLIIGSDVSFGGRDNLFRTHGEYEIFDYNTAIERGYIPADYFEFWGYEDKKLFEYAKAEILNQYAKGEPFNVTLLTVDTHFMEGYQCEDCLKTHSDPYLNTLNCSSKQIYNFVEWIKDQDFYENTTIVIAGDHLNMGGKYIATIDRNYNRTVYYTIVNSAVEYTGNGEHLYSTLDFFPTTLAAMGVEIEGNRLGLGTNLFATDMETLSDKYGHEGLFKEMAKRSDYYMQNFIGGE